MITIVIIVKVSTSFSPYKSLVNEEGKCVNLRLLPSPINGRRKGDRGWWNAINAKNAIVKMFIIDLSGVICCWK
jgi:hypothetical protein